ncbi:MAG: 5-(carboxyamino)imidazole ribonucleotide mutase [Spirochaetota bacterium]
MSVVSVILGSDSDIDVFKKASSVLEDFGIPYERRIISAHRTPEILKDYVEDARRRGIKVFIAIAGMSAALPGVIASMTTLPVIGVPVSVNSTLMGFDSLLSMVQMPPGIPVATVAVNGGKNAALLAAEMLAISDAGIAQKLDAYRAEQQASIIEKDTRFREGHC